MKIMFADLQYNGYKENHNYPLIMGDRHNNFEDTVFCSWQDYKENKISSVRFLFEHPLVEVIGLVYRISD